MTFTEIFGVAAAVIGSLGGGAAIVWAASNFLGKVWSERLMQRERRRHEEELDRLREELRHMTERNLSELRSHLELQRQYQYHEYADKLAMYRAVADVIADIIVDGTSALNLGHVDRTALEQFERKRLRLYGYLGMLAPQTVMTALDNVMDEILDMLAGTTPADFARIRDLAYVMLNEIRKDVALNKDPVRYTGRR